jgi:type II secretory pathway component PulF
LRSLGLLTSNGVPLPAALDQVKDISRHKGIRGFWTTMRERILKGDTPFEASAFAAYHLHPVDADNLVATFKLAFDTGDPSTAIQRLAKVYEAETDTALDSIGQIVNPLATAGVGAIVGFIVLSIVIPMSALSLAIMKSSRGGSQSKPAHTAPARP